jgi:hypothetical protein
MEYAMVEFKKALEYKNQLKLENKMDSEEKEEATGEEEEEEKKESPQQYLGRMSKRDLFKRLHSFLVKCLRKIRAYNFDHSLIEQLNIYYIYLFESRHVLDRDIIQLRYNYANAYQNIKKKAENDPNLVSNQVFQSIF